MQIVTQLIQLEEIRLQEVKAYLDEHDIGVQGFFHMSRLSDKWSAVLQEQLLLLSGFHRDQNPRLKTRRVATRICPDPSLPETSGLLSILDKLNIFDAEINDGRKIHQKDMTSNDIIQDISPV